MAIKNIEIQDHEGNIYYPYTDSELVKFNDGTIKDQINDIEEDRIYYCGATTGTNDYVCSNSKIKAYKEGLTIRIKIGITNTDACTININSLGAKPILDSNGNPISANGFKADIIYQLSYNGVNFIVLGKGGGGTATPDKIMKKYTATTDAGLIEGTMDRRTDFYIIDKFDPEYNMRDDTFKITMSQLGGTINGNANCGKITLSDVPTEYISSGCDIYVQNLMARFIASGVKIGGDRGIVGTYTGATKSIALTANDDNTISNYTLYKEIVQNDSYHVVDFNIEAMMLISTDNQHSCIFYNGKFIGTNNESFGIEIGTDGRIHAIDTISTDKESILLIFGN